LIDKDFPGHPKLALIFDDNNNIDDDFDDDGDDKVDENCFLNADS